MFFIKSQNQNHYLINKSVPQVLLANPILEYLVKLEGKGIPLSRWINNLKENEVVSLNDKIKTTKSELTYYYKYLEFLKKNNFFGSASVIPMDKKRYTARAIEFFLANSDKVTFEVTDSCNLNCKYCGYGELYQGYDKRTGKNLSVKTAKNLLNFLDSLKRSTLNRKFFKKMRVGFYGGEPLLNFPLIEEIVSCSRSIWGMDGVAFDITTNGTLLDKYVDFLVKNQFTLRISMDGNEFHNSYRLLKNGEPSFPIVFRNAKLVREKYPEYFKNKVRFFAVHHKKNSIDEMTAFFQENFNKEPLVTDVSLIGVNPEKKEDFYQVYSAHQALNQLKPGTSETTTGSTDERFSASLFDIRGAVFSHTYYIVHKYDQLLDKSSRVIPVWTGTCDPFRKKVFLSVNGKLLPCERVPQYYALGEADDNGVRLDFQAVADKYNHWYAKLSKLCNNCKNSQYCDQCILRMDLSQNECKCDKFKTEESYRKKLQHILSTLEDNPGAYFNISKKE